MGCNACKLSFTSPLHTPTVTGQDKSSLYVSFLSFVARVMNLTLQKPHRRGHLSCPSSSKKVCVLPLDIARKLTHFTSVLDMIQAANIYRALSLLKTLPPSTLDSPDVTKKILGDRPNTYTFTKVKRFYHYQSFLFFSKAKY